MPASLDFQRVSFSFDSLAAPLLQGLTVHFPRGWTGVVGPNGSGKTTILRLAAGELRPDRGAVLGPRRVAYGPQRTDDPPPALATLLLRGDADSHRLCGRLGLAEDWLARWDTLSHGERKRAQIGTALFERPEVLAIDEPTNHLDAHAYAQLERALSEFDGIGLLVSHDRALLDRLCDQCLFLCPPAARLRPGNYSAGSRQAQLEEQHARQMRQEALRELRRVEAEMARRRQIAAREHKLRSKRGLDRHDRDGRAKIDAARVADSKAGAPLRQMAGRRAQAQARVERSVASKPVEPGIWLDACRARADAVLRVPAGEIRFVPDPAARDGSFAARVCFPELSLAPSERIAITGSNGSGKSTLIRHLLPLVRVPVERVMYLPQELTAAETQTAVNAIRSLPNERLGRIMQIVRRLGSEPRRLLETVLPSPGEVRKLLLALGALRNVQVLILDEPTNHLDLPSLECVEAALREFPGALLLVSHDQQFRTALAARQWRLSRDGPSGDALVHLD